MNEHPSILVVDDNHELAENIAEILAYENIASTIANDGRSALDRLDQQNFDLVITDVRMPGMDGVALLRSIHQRWPAMPIIVMSAYASDAVLEEAAVEGALEVLIKPIDVDHMLGLIRRIAEPNAPILLVEDNDALRVTLAECLLDLADVLPYPARDIASAERLLEAIAFRAAIVDVRLPDGDGLAFGRRLKEQYGEDFALLYVTAYLSEAHEELQSMMRSSRAMKILEKPFPSSRLLDMVTRIIQ